MYNDVINYSVSFQSYWLVYLSSVLNPIIYGARSSTFRQSYREILCGAKRTKILTVGKFRC